jgi:hypothetical protein
MFVWGFNWNGIHLNVSFLPFVAKIVLYFGLWFVMDIPSDELMPERERKLVVVLGCLMELTLRRGLSLSLVPYCKMWFALLHSPSIVFLSLSEFVSTLWERDPKPKFGFPLPLKCN